MHDRLAARVAAVRLPVSRRCIAVIISLAVSACSVDSLVGSSSLPAGITDPSSMATVRGAVETYRGTRTQFAAAFVDYVANSGLLSDEESEVGDLITPGHSPLDQRVLPEDVDESQSANLYGDLGANTWSG